MELLIIVFIFLIIAKGGPLLKNIFFHGKIQWTWCLWNFLSGNLGGGSKLETVFLFNLCFLFFIF